MNASGLHDVIHGCVRYLRYNAEQVVDVSFDNPITIYQGELPKIEFKMLDGEVVYNHWDGDLEAFETVNHSLTAHAVAPPAQYQPEFIQASSAELLVLN